MTTDTPLMSVRNLSVHFPIGNSLFGPKLVVRAVNNESIDIAPGTFFGLVGESGSGKTTLGRALLKAVPITSGQVEYHDETTHYDLGALSPKELREYRKRCQFIFQDPYAALSPRMTVRDIIAEPLEVMKLTNSRAETDERVRKIARLCRLNLEHLRRYPHAFSGGQRQRISIARALVCNPHFLVADECVAALDVSIQADIVNLLKSFQNDLGLTFLFISHNLSVVAILATRLRSCTWVKLSRLRKPRSCFSPPVTLIRKRCCPPFLRWIQTPSTNPLNSRARYQTRQIHRLVASSTRVAPMRAINVEPRSQTCWPRTTAILLLATSPTNL